MKAFKITYENGTSYTTELATGRILEDAKSYFLGRRFIQSDEKTLLTVINVEEV